MLEILSPLHASAISLSSADFDRCVELARCHGVEMLFYFLLKKHYEGSNARIDEYLEQQKNAYLMAVARSMRQEAAEKDVIAKLSQADIPACIIKGNVIARTIYGDPNCRSSSDIDLLIQTGSLAEADRILESMGFRRHDSLPLKFVKGRLHHLVYCNEGKDILLEMHWDFGYPLYFNMTPDEIWEGVTGDYRQGYSLTPENMVLMLLMHHFRHGFREFKILVDILWSFNKYDKVIDWRGFSGTLRKFGLVKTTLIVLQQLDDLWDLADGRLESFTILRQQLATLPERPAKFLFRYFKINLERKETGALDMQVSKLALDKKTNVLYAFAKIFFPKPQEIEAFYPGTGKWMLPVNYLRFILWRVKRGER
ncbi:MAG: nucleotidyltransferase family protein [Smithella sp.]